MKPTKKDIARRFGDASKAYAESPGHASGADLGMLVQMIDPQPSMTVLDVATGAGHTAAALAARVKEVIAVDLAEGMIAETNKLFTERGISNARALVMDVESLSFAAGTFDVVTCRIAAHHFLDPVKAAKEIARVLKKSGRFALEDSCAPDDPALDRFINHVEALRDPTHVRAYSKREWYDMLEAAGFEILTASMYRKTHDVADWIGKCAPGVNDPEKVYAALAAAPHAAGDYFDLKFQGNRAISYTDDKILILAAKVS